ncbi:MFS transporter [Candidatus Bathyarchaeota archaeon]|nr:MFS transporter [Candidatus Bathyarchaeota archaeon]
MESSKDEKSSVSMFFVPAMTIAFFSTCIIESITSIFLIDLATTFFRVPDSVSLAITGQLVTLASVVSVVFGILLGVLSVKFDHKKLLFFGVFCIALGTLGCLLAPDFFFMQVFYPLEGIGTVIVSAMSLALIGELLVLTKRGKATGWLLSGASIAGISSSVVIYFFFSYAQGWRPFLLWFALPIALLSLTAVYFGVPSASQRSVSTGENVYLKTFKQVLLKKSSAACLIANMVRHTAIAYAMVWVVSFFRENFGLSISSATLFTIGNLSLFTLGSIVGGHLINRIGRKRQIVLMLLFASPALIAAAFIPNLWISVILHYAFFFMSSMGYPASMSLTLEQVPTSRGTMMSINAIFITLGLALGTAVGGVALVLGGWVSVLLSFSALSLIAVAIYFFCTKDPCA